MFAMFSPNLTELNGEKLSECGTPVTFGPFFFPGLALRLPERSPRTFSAVHSSAKQSWPFQVSLPARLFQHVAREKEKMGKKENIGMLRFVILLKKLSKYSLQLQKFAEICKLF